MLSLERPFLAALEPFKHVGTVLQSCRSQFDRGVRFVQSAKDEESIVYAELLARALSTLGHLQRAGLRQGDKLVLVTDELALFTATFWACALGGIVVAPIATPTNEAGRDKLLNVLRTLGDGWLASDRLDAVCEGVDSAALAPARRVVLSRTMFDGSTGQCACGQVLDDTVLIQFSSGSTGQPKGVQITSRNLFANASAIADRCRLDAERDRSLNWMPLTHDFGIVFCHVMPTLFGVEHTLISTATFMRHPLLWMQKASDLKATITAGPNYAYHLFLKRYKPESGSGWDLSRLRVVVNGAEPISCELSRQFFAEMNRHGLSSAAAKPAYGLAESTLMVTYCGADEGFESLWLDRRRLAPGDAVVPSQPADPEAVEFARLGTIGRNMELRICDTARRSLPDGHVGSIETRSPSVTPGYYGREDLTRSMISADGWLDTGDLGFVQAGHLYVTGRRKDLIIVNGANYYPHDLEATVAEIPPLDLNAVAACAVRVARQDREGLALFLRSRESEAAFEELADRVRDHVLLKTGLPVDFCLAVRQIPKTTSGKVQRFLLAEQFSQGAFDAQIAAARARRTNGALRDAWDRVDSSGVQSALLSELFRLAPSLDQTDPQVARTPMMELGLASLRLVELLNRINASLDLDLPISVMFEHSTVEALARLLMKQHQAAKQQAEQDPEPERLGTSAAADMPTQSSVGDASEPRFEIAIVGMACRFPGQVQTPDLFWQKLVEGFDATGAFPRDRWDPAINAHATTDRGAYLDGLQEFDYRFFRLTPAEAQRLDPQQRLLLTVSWEAFESAGIDPTSLRGTATGVFTGISGSDYAQAEARAGALSDIGPHAFTGTAPSVASGRLSFFYGLEGPNVAVDTACSSALAAVHLAVRALRAGDCDLALASAVNLILSPDMQVGLSRLNALSPDGRCKTFDASADGYARGEGCAGVVLKRLQDALADGDPVLAVIRGTAMNHDGASNGLTAPNGAAQQKLIRTALRDARLAPGDVDYVEAHGTGTALGDPVEVVALSAAYAQGREPHRALRIGSVKTNLGHLEAAAGMASLFKVVLAMRHGVLPATLHQRQPNPMIPWDRLVVQVVDTLQPWPTAEGADVRRAGVSAFGMSGTNVHLVLEQAPLQSLVPPHTAESEDAPTLLMLSARTDEDLVAMAHRMGTWLRAHPSRLHDMARTLACHRASMPVRLSLAGRHADELTVALGGVEPNQRRAAGRKPPVVFVFAGQGSQQAAVLRDLWDHEPVFRESLQLSARAADPVLGRSLLDLLLQAGPDELARTENTQAVAVATGLALYDLWRSWGIEPKALIGHSVGEIAAAAASGSISRDAALAFAAKRGALMAATPPGAMLAVGCDRARLGEVLGDLPRAELAVAAVNGQQALSLAGSMAAIGQAEQCLKDASIRCSRLAVSHAFHSPMLDPVLPQLRSVAAELLKPLDPNIALVSCVTATVLDAQTLGSADFWVAHARDTVRFEEAVRCVEEPDSVFIELGARAVFASLAALERPASAWLASSGARGGLRESLLHSLGRAHELGLDIDTGRLFSNRPGRLVSLPHYPFQGTTPMLSPVRNPAAAHKAHSQADSGARGGTSESASRSIRQTLVKLVGQISGLGEAEIDPTANWFALGLDSLLVLQLQLALNRAFRVDIKLNEIFEQGTTLDDLTELVARHAPAAGADGQPGRQDTEPPVVAGAAMVQAGPTAVSQRVAAAQPAEPFAVAASSVPGSDGMAADLEALMVRQVEALSRLCQQQLTILQSAPGALQAVQPPAGASNHASRAAVPAFEAGLTGVAASAAVRRPSVAQPAAAPVEVKGLYKQIPGRKANWSAERSSYVKALAQAYNGRTRSSRAMTQAGRIVYANPRAVIGFRPEWKEMTYPLHVQRAQGAYVWDVDGNRYVDITMGFGVTLFGHDPAFVREALIDELGRGAPLGPQTPHALEVAQRISHLTGAQRVGFFTTGSEAVMVAVRLARAVTHRTRIVIFTNAYHGTFDGFLAMGWMDDGQPQTYPIADGTPPKMVEDVVVLRYGDPKALDTIRAMAGELAAVLVEPVQSRDPSVQPREFLQELRRITAESSTALIFDEMIMGFRVHPGGAQRHFDVRADICTYGKVVGGGMPIGVVAGDARFLDAIDGGQWHYGDDSGPSTRTAFVAGTFNSHPLSMAAARAVLEHLQSAGPLLQERLNERTAAMAARLNDVFARENAPIRCVHFSSLFRFEFSDDTELLNYHLLQEGVFVWEGRNCFLSTAHTDEDVDFIVQAVERGVRAMRSGGYLQTPVLPGSQLV